MLKAIEIAKCSKRLVGIALGAEDFCADLGVRRSAEGSELQLARQTIVLAAKAAGIDAFDTVFSNVADEEGLIAETMKIKALGFTGKSVIHPRQIEPVHRVFAPTEEEIRQAQRLIVALQEAERRGSGVVAVDGKMIDAPSSTGSTPYKAEAWGSTEQGGMVMKQSITFSERENHSPKLVSSLEEAIRRSGLQDGMTISFHHHFREGDQVLNQVMDVIAHMGFRI